MPGRATGLSFRNPAGASLRGFSFIRFIFNLVTATQTIFVTSTRPNIVKSVIHVTFFSGFGT
jgi:hypothetical protein